jgi:hypothetical protein
LENKQFPVPSRIPYFSDYTVGINSSEVLKAEGVFDKSGCWVLGHDESHSLIKFSATFTSLMRKSRHSEDDLKPLLKDDEAMSQGNTDPFYTVKE